MKADIRYRQIGKDALSNVRHSHDRELELIQIISGQGNVIVGETIEAFSAGAVFLIDGASLHYICPEADTPYIRNKLIIGKETLYDLLSDRLSGGMIFWQPNLHEREELDEYFCRAVSARQNGEDLLAYSEVFRLLHFCTGLSPKRTSEYRGVAADVMDYINEHAPNIVTLVQIADAIHMNQYHICRVFKRETGMTVHSYINSMRISHAKQLLRTTDIPVAEVSEATGFNGISSLTKSFQKTVGMTPTAYRKKFSDIAESRL